MYDRNQDQPTEQEHKPAQESIEACEKGTYDDRLGATYSPEDNKLRLYSVGRLDKATYQRIKEAGFGWAPKQNLFVAPMWTPERETLLLELCGDIGDENTSLADRTAQRAERFELLSERRKRDSSNARKGVDAITGHIPLGQPILVGHHSERRARKDAERIENGMRKAVRMWETADYWTQRARGALQNVAHKERPEVRARRIKGIEADLRKNTSSKEEAALYLRLWNQNAGKIEALRLIADRMHVIVHRDGALYWTAWDALRPDGERSPRCPVLDVETIFTTVAQQLAKRIERADRWIGHCQNRLTYEQTMLADSGYIAPPKRATKAVLPLLNYGGEIHYQDDYRREPKSAVAHAMTKAELAAIHSEYKGTRISADGTHRVRFAIIRSAGASSHLTPVFLTDSKVHKPPTAGQTEDGEVAARIAKAKETIQATAEERQRIAAHNASLHKSPAERAPARQAEPAIEAMREQLREGVTVVSAPQLFATPAALAERMADLAADHLQPGMRVLEPSAGTGNLLSALPYVVPFGPVRQTGLDVVAIEINQMLAAGLRASGLARTVKCANFLQVGQEIGQFDLVLMNPPFANGSDIEHIHHAMRFLKPGGRLVALCANGPRQQAKLQPLVDKHRGTWEALPEGTFQEAGTMVRTALMTFVLG